MWDRQKPAMLKFFSTDLVSSNIYSICPIYFILFFYLDFEFNPGSIRHIGAALRSCSFHFADFLFLGWSVDLSND